MKKAQIAFAKKKAELDGSMPAAVDHALQKQKDRFKSTLTRQRTKFKRLFDEEVQKVKKGEKAKYELEQRIENMKNQQKDATQIEKEYRELQKHVDLLKDQASPEEPVDQQNIKKQVKETDLEGSQNIKKQVKQGNTGSNTSSGTSWSSPGVIIAIVGAGLVLAILIWIVCAKKEEEHYYGYDMI